MTAPLIPYKLLEVSKRAAHVEEPTVFLSNVQARSYATITSDILAIITEYQNAQQDTALIIGIANIARRTAAIQIVRLAHSLSVRIRNGTIYHTIHWWYRSPSNAGADNMVIAFRLLGLYELAQPSV